MHAPQKAKCETALQTALDAIEKHLRTRMNGGVTGSVGVTVKATQGLIQHIEFASTEAVRIDALS